VQELVAVVKALNSAVQEISQQVDACARTQMAGFKQIMATIQGLDLSSPDSSEYNELESKIRAPFSAGTGHLPKFSMDLIAHLRELKVECKDLKVGAERAKKQLDSARDETSTTIELG
jgi:histidinol phosphatase-like enzyme